MNGADFASLRTIDDIDVAGKRVLLRTDLNVPLAGGSVSDTTRIQRVLPTIRTLAERGAKVVVLSHFGRPNGKPNADMSLKPVADIMRGMLGGTSLRFVEECVGVRAEGDVSELKGGEIALMENLRFHPGEEENCTQFAQSLGMLGDIFVNEAFSAAHRAHASIEAVTNLLPSFAGPLMMAEIEALRTVLDEPEEPVVAIVGGAKISTKLPVLTNLIAKVDSLIVGGAMANTFLYAAGHAVGKSLCEPELAEIAIKIVTAAQDAKCKIILPMDVCAADEFRANAASRFCDVDAVGPDEMILDIGPATLADLKLGLAACRTLLWNGPLGAFEFEPFGWGTFELAKEAALLTRQGTLKTIAGGGDTVAALNSAGVAQDFTYISTAGGAFLEWLEGRELAGIIALMR